MVTEVSVVCLFVCLTDVSTAPYTRSGPSHQCPSGFGDPPRFGSKKKDKRQKKKETQAAENKNRIFFFFSSKQRNKGITVCKIRHFCLAGFFLWKISGGLD